MAHLSAAMHEWVGRGISVGIATRCRLDGPGIESGWGARFSAPIRSGHETLSASYRMGTGSYPGVKRPGRDDLAVSSSPEVKERVELHISHSLSRSIRAFVACSRVNFHTRVGCQRWLNGC